jgi:two-component system, LuxR family, sensor kinase FixL
MSGMRLLLVEDDLACRRSVTVILEQRGAIVTALPDAEQAVDLLKSAEFDAIITDIMLPEMDGITLLRHVRAQNTEIPVIVVTGYGSIDTAVNALKLGAQDYILKPFEDQDKLIDSVWTSVAQYKLMRKNKSLQEQLRESEQTFRALFNNANDAIFLHGMSEQGEIGKCTEVNDVACKRLGYSSAELLGMTLLDLTAVELRGETTRMMKDLLTWDSIVFETLHVTKDGARIPIEISSHVFTLRGSNVVLSIGRDISDRREMEMKIAEASERERRILGRDLHDVLCQDLASIEMLASLVKKTLESENSAGRSDINMICDLARRTVVLAKRMCTGLYPVELEKEGLHTALEQLAGNEERMFHVSCAFSGDRNIKPVSQSASLHLYRIAQEAVRNAVKHSGGKHISIVLEHKDDGVLLTVEDDGKGIPPDAEISGGMGLHIMKYRARVLGAVLKISKREEGGARVTCFWR